VTIPTGHPPPEESVDTYGQRASVIPGTRRLVSDTTDHAEHLDMAPPCPPGPADCLTSGSDPSGVV
jgi:hypothetical protein